jgi:hypothetical protein
MPFLRRQRGSPSASRARLQSRQLPAHAGDAGADQGLVDDDAARKADQDRREGRRSRALRLVPDGRGCYTVQRLRRHLAHDRGTSAASNHVNGVVSSVVTRLNETTGKVCLYDGKFRISPRSASVRTTVEGRRRRHACQNSPVGTDLGSYWLPSGECRLSAPQPKKSCGIVQDFSISRHYTSTNGPFVIEFGKWRSTLR